MNLKLYEKFRLQVIVVLLAMLPFASFAQDHSVEGKVTDDTGMPIPGVTVLISGTSKGVVTDINGSFTIKASPNDKLVFSFIGMQSVEMIVGTRSKIDIAMKEDSKQLEDVVIVGFGVQKKETVIGAVSQVSGEKIQKVKVGGSLENALQGNLPGLRVEMVNPTPGEEAASINMAIRGTSSMKNNAPLVIVDGIERSFSNIDPNEIASISILKDASATAVYGVRGANGVILVTTKRGVDGALQLDFNSFVSFKSPSMLPKYMNSYETMSMYNEALKNDGKWDDLISDQVLEHYKNQDLPYLYPDYNWMENMFRTAIDHSYNLNARGGNKFVKYFVSIGYLNEGDVFTAGNSPSFPYQFDKRNAHYWHERYNFRNNLDFTLSKTTNLTVNLGGNLKVWNKPIDDYTQELWFSSPINLPYYPAEALQQYPDDRIPFDQGVRPFIRPRVSTGEVGLHWFGGRGFYRNKTNEMNADIRLDQKLDFITKGLTISGLYSYNSNMRYGKHYELPSGTLYGYFLDPATQTWNRYNSYGEENLDTPPTPLIVTHPENLNYAFRSHWYQGQLNYNRKFGLHNVGADGIVLRRTTQTDAIFPTYEENWVGRATYDYDSKYLLEASVSRSGSEKFAPGYRFGTFPAFGGGWVLSNEKFYGESLKKHISLMKVRYSYGVIGSDFGIDRWMYTSEFLPIHRDNGHSRFGFPFQEYHWIQEGPIPVSNATWERAYKQNLAADFSFFGNSLNLTIELFNERREGMLQSRMSVPSYVGVTEIQNNIGSTKSQGMEIVVGYNKGFKNGLFVYGNANINLSENRVVFYDEPASMPFHLKAEGKPVDIAQRLSGYTPGTGIMDGGFYQDFDELFMWPTAAGGSPIVGDFKFIDFNGDGVVDQQDRIVSEYPLRPNAQYNFDFGAQYKGWSIDFQVYATSATQFPMRQGGMFFLYPFSNNSRSAYTAHGDYWSPDNRDAQWPAVHSVSTNQYNYQISQFSMIAGGYLRLRNVRVGYDFNPSFIKKIGLSNMNLGISGTNLFTWTRLGWGGDPEGFNFGTDFGAYPQMKRVNLELAVTF